MQSRIRLMVHCPNSRDATSFYRGIGPLTHLARQMGNLDLHFTSEYHWATLALADVLFMQRPYRAQDVDIMKIAKANKKPIWVDLDDDLFNVPISNPAHRIYGNDKTRRHVATCLAMADVVTVSTKFLKTQLEGGASREKGISLNKNIIVVPNALNERLLPDRTPQLEPPNQLIMWRGSSTHHKDLSEYLPQIVELVNWNPKWTFMFQGDKPWFLFEKLGNNAIFADALDPLEYFEMIQKVKPQLMMVPLADDVFNYSKSNIAWLEAIYAGGLALVPGGAQWEEWDMPGCLDYCSPAEFLELTTKLIKGHFDVAALNANAWNFVEENLTLRTVNALRQKVLESLV